MEKAFRLYFYIIKEDEEDDKAPMSILVSKLRETAKMAVKLSIHLYISIILLYISDYLVVAFLSIVAHLQPNCNYTTNINIVLS